MILRYPEQLIWFPPKRFFGNTDAKFIVERQQELQRYMQYLLSLESQCTSPVLRNFLEIPSQPPRPEQPPSPTESTPKRLLAFVKHNLLDLSQPSEQFLDVVEVNERKRLYKTLLYGTAATATDGQGNDRTNCSKHSTSGILSRNVHSSIKERMSLGRGMPEWFDFQGNESQELWASVALAPSAANSEDMATIYKRIFQLSAVNDPGRPIHGVGTLRAEFPQSVLATPQDDSEESSGEIVETPREAAVISSADSSRD